MIPCGNPLAQYVHHQKEIGEAIFRVLDKGSYVLGDEVKLFERDFSAWTDTKEGVGVGSGTEAIHIALKACGIGTGDEVITVSHTAVATIAAIKLAGATPIFVDIDPVFFNLDSSHLEGALSSKTRAVIPVHLYGHPVFMTEIVRFAQKHGLYVIEDCAQSHGACLDGKMTGSMGDLGCFSFYPTKNLGAIGDGGMVVSKNLELAEKVRCLREYGWSQRYVSSLGGWNTRLDEVQAAVLRVKLKYLKEANERRRRIAACYHAGLKGLDLKLPSESIDACHVYHLYVIRSSHRDKLLKYLQAKGIGALVHYPIPVHLQPAYQTEKRGSDLRITEQVAGEVLSLPIYPELKEDDVGKVIEVVEDFFK